MDTRQTWNFGPRAVTVALALAACGRIELASAPGEEADGGSRPIGSTEMRPSCKGAAPTCGIEGTDCCAELYVPLGTFQVEPGLDSPVLPTTVSSFYLDEYEVTARRFRAFLRDYDAWRGAGNPKQDAGAYQWIAGLGWQERWQNALSSTAAELEDAVTTCNGAPFSALLPNVAEDLPINCVTWHEALAFCIWDDARLPTEAEWIHAATGGSYGRRYPWGNDAPSLERAVYGCLGNSPCTLDALPTVGSRPPGAGRWNHLDLAGSMNEWVFDGGSIPPFGGANPFNVEDERLRILRGGDWLNSAFNLRITARTLADPGIRNFFWGLRCARENPGAPR